MTPSIASNLAKDRLKIMLVTSHANADNFQTRDTNAMKIGVRGAHPPPLPNGTTNGPNTAKFVKRLNYIMGYLSHNDFNFYEKWRIGTATFSSANLNHPRPPKPSNEPPIKEIRPSTPSDRK